MTEVIGIALCALFLIAFLKPTRPEMALLCTMAAGGMILLAALPYLSSLVRGMEGLAARTPMGGELFAPLLKVVGICFLAQTAAELCRDAGERALGMKVELFGKILICTMTLPLLSALTDAIVSIVP